jgi:hypothetical protein
MKATLAFISICLAACSASVQTPVHAPTAPASKGSVSCRGVGPRACEVPPSAAPDLCAQLRTCLVGWVMSEAPERNVLTGVEQCHELTDTASAPAAAGIGATAVLEVDALVDDVPAQGWFLFAQSEQGLCLVDSPLEPAATLGGYYRADFASSWSAETTPPKFRLQAHERRFQPVDEEEAEESTSSDSEDGDGDRDDPDTQASEPGLAEELCKQYTYTVAQGRFTRTEASEADGPCVGELL